MDNLHSALASLGLDRQIAVTTAHSLAVLGDSYPPSTATFRRDLLPLLCPILDFHARTGSPFFINAYPYFAGPLRHLPRLRPPPAQRRPRRRPTLRPPVQEPPPRPDRRRLPRDRCRRDDQGGQNPSPYSAIPTRPPPPPSAAISSPSSAPFSTSTPAPAPPLHQPELEAGPASERNYGLFKADGTPVYQLGFTLDNSTEPFYDQIKGPHDKAANATFIRSNPECQSYRADGEELPIAFVQLNMPLEGGSGAVQVGEKWRKQQILELEVYLKRESLISPFPSE